MYCIVYIFKYDTIYLTKYILFQREIGSRKDCDFMKVFATNYYAALALVGFQLIYSTRWSCENIYLKTLKKVVDKNVYVYKYIICTLKFIIVIFVLWFGPFFFLFVTFINIYNDCEIIRYYINVTSAYC